MRRITLGVLVFTSAGAFVACGDDDGGTPNPGGSGGSAGASGGSNAGNGGAAGNPGGNGGGPTGGNGGAGGAGPGPDVTPIGTCTGCVELIVPVTGPNDNSVNPPVNVNDQASFIFTVAAPGADFTNGVVTFRVQALETNANLQVQAFAQNGMAANYAGVYPGGLTFSATDLPLGQWVDLELNLAGYEPLAGAGDAGVVDAGGDAGPLLPNNGFDKSAVAQYGLTVGATAALVGSAVIHLQVDSVTITGSDQTSKTFDASAEGFTLNMFQVPAGTPAAPTHRPAP